MAQHYSIKNEDDDYYFVFLLLQSHFKQGISNIDSSVFTELGDEYSIINPNAKVYKYSMQEKDSRETFEIHYDPINREILDVFFVS